MTTLTANGWKHHSILACLHPLPYKEPVLGWACVVQIAVTCIEGDTPQIKKTETQAVGYVESIVRLNNRQKPAWLAGEIWVSNLLDFMHW